MAREKTPPPDDQILAKLDQIIETQASNYDEFVRIATAGTAAIQELSGKIDQLLQATRSLVLLQGQSP
jgi:hypothetical protein